MDSWLSSRSCRKVLQSLKIFVKNSSYRTYFLQFFSSSIWFRTLSRNSVEGVLSLWLYFGSFPTSYFSQSNDSTDYFADGLFLCPIHQRCHGSTRVYFTSSSNIGLEMLGNCPNGYRPKTWFALQTHVRIPTFIYSIFLQFGDENQKLLWIFTRSSFCYNISLFR